MKTLMGSCWEIFPLKFGENEGLIWCQGDVSPRRKDFGFLGNQRSDVRMGFSLSVSSSCRTFRSVSAVASALSPGKQTIVGSEGTDERLVADQPKIVHVRFKLTKECAFGQHFMIVGDDPSLGLWDPSDGLEFDWSDGHVWTAELDVPCGKVIKYKFILKQDDNTITWQPGPDRTLQTWNTDKTIIVSEDWNLPEFQSIAEEEEFITDSNSQNYLSTSELLTSSENLTETTQDEGTDVKKRLVGTDDQSSLADEDVEDTVLVAGLIPMPADETDATPPNKMEPKDDYDEPKDERISASLHTPETNEIVTEKEQDLCKRKQLQIVKRNMHWGRGLFKKFLTILGF